MRIDERIREELTSAVASHAVREDDALVAVRSHHQRVVARARIARQVAVVTVVLALFAGVAVFAAWRRTDDRMGSAADRFRATATVRIAPAPGPPGPRAATTTVPPSDPSGLALRESTRNAALARAHLRDTGVTFRATTNAAREVLTLAVTGPSPADTEALIRAWVAQFRHDQRAVSLRQSQERIRVLGEQINRLHAALHQIDDQLKRIDPALFPDDSAFRYGPHPRSSTQPRVRENASTHELELVNERIQLLATLADKGAERARLTAIPKLGGPGPFPVIEVTPAVRIEPTSESSHTWPLWLGGLFVLLGGALAAWQFRRRRVTR